MQQEKTFVIEIPELVWVGGEGLVSEHGRGISQQAY